MTLLVYVVVGMMLMHACLCGLLCALDMSVHGTRCSVRYRVSM